jgi:signal transduction histidine kinase/CheY-like chemotaxis protein/ligand-binding sensor domain-containing protein
MKLNTILFFLFFCTQAISQEYLPAEHLTEKDGLSFRDVSYITKDSDGYMWIGTAQGLNRFDGVNWTIYKHQPGNTTSINYNGVWQIYEDKAGNLLIRMSDDERTGKLDYFDKKTETFSSVSFQNIKKDQNHTVLQTVVTPSGSIVAICTLDKQVEGNPVRTFLEYRYSGDGEFLLNKRSFESPINLSSHVFFSEGNRIWLFSEVDYDLINFDTPVSQTFSFESFGGYNLPIDANGKFWYPALNPKEGKVFDTFNLPPNIPLEDWKSFTVDNHYNIWLSTSEGRIYKYDIKRRYINELGEFDIDNFTLNRRLFQDEEGTLWIPHSFGVSKVRKRNSYFENYMHDSKRWDSRSGSGTEIYSIAQNNKDTLYGIYDYNSLIVFDLKNKLGYKRSAYINPDKGNPDLSAYSGMILCTDDGFLWYGGYREFVARFNPETHELRYFTIPDSLLEPPKNIKGILTPSFKLDKEGKLWFVTHYGGLWSFDRNLQIFSRDITQFFPRGVIGVREQNLWICTDSLLSKINLENMQVRNFELPDKVPVKMQLEIFKVVPYKDKVWIGTRRGLLCFDTLTETFTRYTVADGLSSDIIYIIIPYGDDLWMGTHVGLCRFNIKTGAVKNYYEKDGLTYNEFNREAAAKTPDGELVFGGMNGFNVFHPYVLDSLARMESSKLVLTQFSKLDGAMDTIKVFSANQLDLSEPVNIYHRDKSFTFRYALLSFFSTSENTYSYYLEGYEKDWNYGGNVNFINYPSLSPGTYTFRVKAKDPRGNPGLNELAIPIVVYGPWWSTWWALGLFVLLLVIGLVSYNRYRVRNFERQKRKLEETVKERTKELNSQKERAERSERFKEQFLANMSHQIRTPMHAISGMTDILIRNEHLTPQEKFLNAIQQSSRNLLVILNDILDLSKIEAGKIEIENIPMNLSKVIGNVADVLRAKAEEKGLSLTTSLDEVIPDNIKGDPTRLSQILLNLVGNAIKFTEKGKVQVLITRKGDMLKFAVEDSGIGIPEDQLVRVFGTFEQVNESITRKYGGTGLGLSITKQLVELQEGRIWVESQEGIGSTFFFELPFVPVEAGEKLKEGINPEKLKEMATSLKGVKILLAEDNAFNVMVANDDLEYYIPDVQMGFAENGKEAITEFQSGDYDLILMDIQMPEVSGYDATRAIREIEANDTTGISIPIIAMTASLLKSEINQCYDAGMDSYIPKPYKIEELIGRIYGQMKNGKD